MDGATETVKAAIVFDGGVSDPSLTTFPRGHKMSYKIRLVSAESSGRSDESIQKTDEFFPEFPNPGPNDGMCVRLCLCPVLTPESMPVLIMTNDMSMRTDLESGLISVF